MGKLLTAILIGAGSRGEIYTRHMGKMEDKYKVIAVAEPIESRRNLVKERHEIPDDMSFASWQPIFEKGKIADVAIIATMDKEHLEPTLEAIRLGYDILLEKPVSPDPIECQKIALAAEEKGVKIVVCHVLRYTPFFITIKNLIDEGRLGEIMSVNHEECVGNVHQSHSFVRGNWGNSERSSCMLLQKSCHDMDILQWLIGKKPKKIQSFGSLRYFRKENAPEGSPEYCLDGCPVQDTCPYNAKKLYLIEGGPWFRGTCTREANPTDEMVEKALRTTQYGKCVVKWDNDGVDHQTVNMLFEDDVTVTFTMNAFNKGGRFIHIMGTKGELRASMASDEEPILLYDFETKKTEEIPVYGKDGLANGHGGGDIGIVRTLYEYLNEEYTGCSVSDIRTSVDNHLIVFAAEESKANNTVVDFEEYVARLTKEC